MASVEYGISSKPLNKKDFVARNGVRTSLDPWTPSMVSKPTAQPRPPPRPPQQPLAGGPPPRPQQRPLAGVSTIDSRSDSFRQSRSDLERQRAIDHEEGTRRWKKDVAEIKMMLQMLLEHLDDPTNEEEEEDFDEYEEDSCSEEEENVQLAAAPKVFDEMPAGKICEISDGEAAEEDDDDDEEEEAETEEEEEVDEEEADEDEEEAEDSEREGDLNDEEDEETDEGEDDCAVEEEEEEGEDDRELEEEQSCEDEEEEEEGEEICEEGEVLADDTDLDCNPAIYAIDSAPHLALCFLPSCWQRAQDAHAASHHQPKSHKKPLGVLPEALPSLVFVLKLQLQWKRKRWKMKCWVDLGGKIKFKEGELIQTQP